MDTYTDYFHRLPDEVVQVIFSHITDCTTLVRCMSVSKAFRQQAVRVPSLSIVCPGSFVTYDERLLKIYTMVKAFRNLRSLVVRVGQPKEEPPSWVRCMRYAEIGGSVEKFMFMAAKGGDFSELDATLLGLDDRMGKLHGKLRNGSASSTTKKDGQACLETSENATDMEEVSYVNTEAAWRDIDSDKKGGQRGLTRCRDLSKSAVSIEQTRPERCCLYNCLPPFDASFLSEKGQRKPLSQLSLRQVIAPSNDVLKHMLPVIHFAIVQGLNELRDSLPGFIAMFSELRNFLLVDMAESITVFMREHHIQELKAVYLQDWDGTSNQVKEAPKVEPSFSGLGVSREEDRSKCRSGAMDQELEITRKVNSRPTVSDARDVNCGEELEDSDETGRVSAKDKQVGDMIGVTLVPKVVLQKEKGLAVSINEGSSLRRSGSASSNTWKLPSMESISIMGLEPCKGKQKLLEYQDTNLQGEGGSSGSNWSHKDSGCKGCSLDSVEVPIDGSPAGCSFPSCNDIDIQNGDLIATSLARLKCEEDDTGNSSDAILPACPSACGTSKPCTNALDNSVACFNEHSCSFQSDTELEGDGDSGVILYEMGVKKESHYGSLGRDWKVEHQVEDHGKTIRTGSRMQGIRFTRGAKVESTSKTLLKRCHRSDNLKKIDFCKSLQNSAGLRGFGGLFDSDSLEDVDVESLPVPTLKDVIDRNKHLVTERAALAGNVQDASREASYSADSLHAKNEGVRRDLHVSMCGDNNNDKVGNTALHDRQENGGHFASDELSGSPRALPWNPHETAGGRLVDADAWRHVWQERVRRLRDSLRTSPHQDFERTHEDVRRRPREQLRRHQAMEKDALSFDYTFWRAEQVSACTYIMSDVSMCIATHASEPLGDAEKEVLLQAAIAGPLLVATVSHVNKYHSGHNLGFREAESTRRVHRAAVHRDGYKYMDCLVNTAINLLNFGEDNVLWYLVEKQRVKETFIEGCIGVVSSKDITI